MKMLSIQPNGAFQQAHVVLRLFVGMGLLSFCWNSSMAEEHKHAPTGTCTDWNWPEPPPNPDGKIGYSRILFE